MTLEELMKERGYTDAQIADLAPSLANPGFRGIVEAELTKNRADLDEYDKWFTGEIMPEHQRLLERVANAEADAAGAKARMEAYQKAGLLKLAGTQGGDAARKAVEEADKAAKDAQDAARAAGVDPRYVTSDTFQKAFESTGDAIAVATNIVTSHMQLFPGQFLDMEDLKNKAKAAKMGVKQYWESAYKVSDRREAIKKQAETEKENQIRADERAKVHAEFGTSNPNLMQPLASSNTFITHKKAAGADAKQPWERNPNEITKERIEKAIQRASGRGELLHA